MANNKKIDRKQGSKVNNVSKVTKKKNKKTKVNKKRLTLMTLVSAGMIALGIKAGEGVKNIVFNNEMDKRNEIEIELHNSETKYKKYKEILDKASSERGEEDEEIYKQMKFELEEPIEYETLKATIENDLKNAIRKAGAKDVNINIDTGGKGEENSINISKDGKSQSYDKHIILLDRNKKSKNIPEELNDTLEVLEDLNNIIYKMNSEENIDLTGEELAKYLDVLQRGVEIDNKINNSEITIDDDFNMKVKKCKNKEEKISKVVEGKNVTVEFKDGYKVNVKTTATKANNYQNDKEQTSQRDDMEIG